MSFDCLFRDDAIIKDRKTLSYVKGKQNKKEVMSSKQANQNNGSGVTLGELFGDFFDEFEEEK